MLHRMLAIATALLVLSFAAGGYWYLVHPEAWNRRFSGFIGAANLDGTPLVLPLLPASTDPEPVRMVGDQADAAVEQSSVRPANAITEPEDIAPVCSRPATSEVTRSAGAQVYSWHDASGVLNVSDRPPPRGIATIATQMSDGELEYFNLSIQYPGVRQAFDVETPLRSQLNGIYRILTSLLGFEAIRKVNPDIVLHPDRESYHRAALSSTGRDMSAFSGHYSSSDNQAVTYLHESNDDTMSVVRHESVHVITAGILGLTSVWLNEGLADYFQNFSVSGGSSQVTMNAASLNIAQAYGRSPSKQSLMDFLALKQDAWRGPNMQRNYALAWSLVYFLMENPLRKQVLSQLLQDISRSFCLPHDTTGQLGSLYPGGLAALEREFFAWLDAGSARAAHNY